MHLNRKGASSLDWRSRCRLALSRGWVRYCCLTVISRVELPGQISSTRTFRCISALPRRRSTLA